MIPYFILLENHKIKLDTNCSIAGQVIGTLTGLNSIPLYLLTQLKQLSEYDKIEKTINKLRTVRNWYKGRTCYFCTFKIIDSGLNPQIRPTTKKIIQKNGCNYKNTISRKD